ncbi:hypothetical protein ACWCQN_41770 [Streptomyces sp. NPDC001984]
MAARPRFQPTVSSAMAEEFADQTENRPQPGALPAVQALTEPESAP